MSRAHAMMTLVTEPENKVVIVDSKSMHGTFVDGRQLGVQEEAEILSGTEVTFGANIVRTPRVSPTRRLSGYGVSENELMLSESSGDDQDDYEFDDEEPDLDEDEDSCYSSGASSSPPDSPASSSRSLDSTTKEGATSTKSSVPANADIVCIDDDEPRRETSRAKMPSIPSLVNLENQPVSTPWRKRSSHDPEVIIVEQYRMVRDSDAKRHLEVEKSDPRKPICIDDDDEEENENKETDSENDEHESEDALSDAENSDPEEDQKVEDSGKCRVANEGGAAEDIRGEGQEKIPSTSDSPTNTKESEPKRPILWSQYGRSKGANPAWTENPRPAVEPLPSPYLSRPTLEAHQSLPPLEQYKHIGGIPYSSNPYQWCSTRTPLVANPESPRPTNQSPRQITQPIPPLMMTKPEFFEARSHNRAEAERMSVRAMTLDMDPVRSRFVAYKEWPYDLPLAKNVDDFTERYENHPMISNTSKEHMADTRASNLAILRSRLQKMKELHDSRDYTDGDYTVEDSGSEEELAQDEDQHEPKESNIYEEMAGFCAIEMGDPEKLSSDNETKEPAPEVADLSSSDDSCGAPETASGLASPPPSEKEVVPEEAVSVAPEPETSSRKRKYERMVHVEVPASGEEFHREEYENVAAVVDLPTRPTKRVRTTPPATGGRVAGYAASFLGGLLVGGAGLFAALVASAAE
ncbi:hypothetical protein EX30DRAFT_123091 [Ascodesmis nigricans]|uniref:FHA domain-containing protein n=1 Tax=Ascodesmis nigricans TaxID=341454 RepID=A0A4S2MPF7_9PEZI|nr:hypothetical protein EX30DRAFT_123091 [Ascodesmis nigricans]